MCNYNISFNECGSIDLRATDREAAEWFEERYMRLPHYEDGALVRIGDCVKGSKGEKMEVSHIDFRLGDMCTFDKRVWHLFGSGNPFSVNSRCGCFERYVEPDSLERIQEDALKTVTDYWGCGACLCGNCPVKIDNLTPGERYNISTRGNYSKCTQAQRLDIIERTRKLYEKSGE
jgi:hypothetical protein